MIRKLLYCVALLYTIPSFSQYCATGGPNSPADSQLKAFQLSGDASTSINFTDACLGNIGVENFLALSANLSAGNSYTAFPSFGSCGGFYMSAGSAWIDFNLDGVFQTTELIGSWSGMPTSGGITDTWNFTVPIGAISGATRLRVIHEEGGVLPLNPCSSFTWGSVMDFTVVIGGGVDCSSFDGDTKADAINVNALPFMDTKATNYCYYSQNAVYPSADVYYRILPTSLMGNIHISLCGASFDTFLSLQKSDGTVLSYNDDGSCGSSSELTFPYTLEDTVYIIVEGWGASSGDYTILINTSTLGIETPNTAFISISPNPFVDYIVISGLADNTPINITDLSGKVIETTNIFNGKLNLTHLNAGNYFISWLNSSGINITKKITKI